MNIYQTPTIEPSAFRELALRHLLKTLNEIMSSLSDVLIISLVVEVFTSNFPMERTFNSSFSMSNDSLFRKSIDRNPPDD